MKQQKKSSSEDILQGLKRKKKKEKEKEKENKKGPHEKAKQKSPKKSRTQRLLTPHIVLMTPKSILLGCHLSNSNIPL